MAKVFYALSERLQLHWIRGAISDTIVRNHWNHLAILNLRNDLHANQHNLTELVLQIVENKRHTSRAMAVSPSSRARSDVASPPVDSTAIASACVASMVVRVAAAFEEEGVSTREAAAPAVGHRRMDVRRHGPAAPAGPGA